MELGTLTEITIYPVKSVTGIRIDKANITEYGIAHPDDPRVLDRKWMISDGNGKVLIQNQFPKMAVITQKIVGDYIELSAPGKPSVRFPIESPNKYVLKCSLRYWSETLSCYSYGTDNEVSKWLDDFFGKQGLQIVCLNFELDSPWPKLKDDYNSYMLISTASLAELNSRLENHVSMRNFRPNFVVEGCSAFAEINAGFKDTWSGMKINDIVFQRTKPCVRCIMTTVDPNTGIADKQMQPLRKLKEYRIEKEIDETSPKFGVYFSTSSDIAGQIRLNHKLMSV